MYKVKILGTPKPLTPEQRKKAEDKAKKSGKEFIARERPAVLSTFTVDTDSPAEVTKVVANTIAKQSAQSQGKVAGIEMRKVGASDPGAVAW